MSQHGSLRFGSPSWHQCTTGSRMHVFVQVTEFWCRNCEDCLFFFHICSIVLCELSVTPHSCLVGFGIRSSYLLTCMYKHFTLRVSERFESAYGQGSSDLVPSEYRSVHPGWYASPACCLKPEISSWGWESSGIGMAWKHVLCWFDATVIILTVRVKYFGIVSFLKCYYIRTAGGLILIDCP